MNVWEFGLETTPFEAVVAGQKTIEGRLNKGKFAEFATGDIIKVRADYRDDQGNRHDGEPDAARLKIVAIRKYPDFAAMVKGEGYKRVSATPISEEATIDGYSNYYPLIDQTKYGVLAIEVRLQH